MTIDLGLDKVHGAIDSQYGLVCAMDVLGMRQQSETNAQGTLMKLLELKRSFRLEGMAQNHKKNRDRHLPFDEEFKYYTTDAEIDTFFAGDTCFIAKRFQKNLPCGHQIWNGTRDITRFFRSAMYQGLMMRGALAIGKYYWSYGDELVIGQAINAAVADCEIADWIGLHFTKESREIVRREVSGLPASYQDLFFDYEVPRKPRTKSNGTLICIGWPSFFWPIIGVTDDPLDAIEKGRSEIETIFAKQKPPDGARRKYRETRKFFDRYKDWFINAWLPVYKRELEHEMNETVRRLNYGRSV
ncbi:MAG: hypothetical protein LBU23_13230 [Planctomycetota bacterium]|nr:hypothetical protein [Planctomycetota bacterium]